MLDVHPFAQDARRAKSNFKVRSSEGALGRTIQSRRCMSLLDPQPIKIGLLERLSLGSTFL